MLGLKILAARIGKMATKKAVSRPSQATGKAPSKRLVERRKKTAKGKPGYFANPINGKKGIPFYIAFVEYGGDRFYYAGSKATGEPLFDDDIQKAFLSREVEALKRHLKAEALGHLRAKKLSVKIIRAFIDQKGNTIPNE